MNIDQVKEEVERIFGDKKSNISLMEDNSFLIVHGEDRLRVFPNYQDAQKYIDRTFKRYFSKNRHQLVHVYKQCFKDDGWKQMVNWEEALKSFKSKYDNIVGKTFKDENRQKMIAIIERDFQSYIESACGNESILSSFLYPFFNIGELIEEVSEALGYRVYDYGQHFYTSDIVL